MKPITRRAALQTAATTLAAPFVWRLHAHAAPSETVLHASFGANGMALADINSLTGSKHLKLVAVAEVDDNRVGEVKKRFPQCNIYKDYRELLDKEKSLNSVNVSTPDHMHAPIAMRAINRGLNVYGQKPLTQTIYEARRLTEVATEKKLVTQMGIQIHSHPVHKQVVKLIHDGAIGKVKEVHSWSGKSWGDDAPKPDRKDPVPKGFDWNLWLGVAAERPFIGGGYYHPGNWRKRLDFGTGTFGDMGCHILDPVFGALGVGNPLTVRSELPGPNADNWSLDVKVKYVFPGTKFTADTVALTWYNGKARPPAEVKKARRRHAQRSRVGVYRREGRAVLAVHRRPGAAPGRGLQGLQDAAHDRRQPLLAVRGSGPRQRPDVRPVQLFRPAHGDGVARLPRDPLPQHRSEVGHEGAEVHQQR